MTTEVKVAVRPKCDICSAPAEYDAKTTAGPWAFLCTDHFGWYAESPFLGTGHGQRLIVTDEVTA